MIQCTPTPTSDFIKTEPKSTMFWPHNMEAVDQPQNSLYYPGGASNTTFVQSQYPNVTNYHQQNYYQSWSQQQAAVAAATSGASTTSSPVHVNFIQNANVIHNYPPQSLYYPYPTSQPHIIPTHTSISR